MDLPVKDFDASAAMAYFRAKTEFTTNAEEVWEMLKSNEPINVIDVREPADFARGHIPGAVNLPKSEWGGLGPITRDRMNVFYCYSQACHLAATAALEFASKGYPVMEMEGGFESWQQNRYDIAVTDDLHARDDISIARPFNAGLRKTS